VLVQNLQKTYIFFDKRLKLLSTGNENQMRIDRNAIFFSLLNLQSAFFLYFPEMQK